MVKETHIIHFNPNLSFDVRDKTLLERQYYYIEVFTREKQSGLLNGMLILSRSVWIVSSRVEVASLRKLVYHSRVQHISSMAAYTTRIATIGKNA